MLVLQLNSLALCLETGESKSRRGPTGTEGRHTFPCFTHLTNSSFSHSRQVDDKVLKERRKSNALTCDRTENG